MADVRQFDFHFMRHPEQRVRLGGFDHERHALLRFGDKNFPGPQTGVFERHALQIDDRAARNLGEFADRRREAARAVIRAAFHQSGAAGAFQKIRQQLLRDWAADLHGGLRRMLVNFHRRKRRAVNAVLADAPARHDNSVARVNPLFPRIEPLILRGHDAARPAIHQRLARVAVVKNNRAVDRRNARFVAAVLNPFAHAVKNALRVQLACQQGLLVVRRAEAEDVRIEQQPRPADACAERIAVIADDAGNRPAIRVNRGGRIVRFDFPDKQRIVVNPHDARIIGENLHEPAIAPRFEALAHRVGRGFDVSFEERINRFALAGRGVFVMNHRAELLVFAML